ncbi:tRNA (adenosine(37)-N6)-threonylcarbamoyltransferase complex dimerization subunit type 1 TsaB [Deinococcus maricopensis]|uniref:Universal protein YeaZ n=1 Tax=Deinococcus maricopensis (strain DSM 21211 / LMG 22137 / NRRL B-23946 / LB-34) TaxID=709986 RepID=E8UB07_DEIML|nr:tRNA (adenosine(37)-N6)-threonylcarbamoyltransferase complex dimerization subunit type 1 TsaB [Deinococcus maricopensis]ADV68246.1 universal protein YeaZ [Deinococcus maricopensis DSM 21211]
MILAVETATPFLAVALVGEGVRVARVERVERAHAERLAGAVQAAFEEAGVPMRADGVVIGTGPGSYTGVRVGASYALGVARAWGVPVRGVSTLEALVGGHEGRVAVSLDARKGQVYGAVYDVEGGVVRAVPVPPAKFALEAFGEVAGGGVWVRDGAPDPVALAWNGAAHGVTDWALSYL